MYTSAILTSLGMVMGAVLYTLMIDRTARITLFACPMLGCSLSLIALGFFFLCLELDMDMTNFSFVPATAVTFYSFQSAISLGAILLLRNELFATDVRAVGIGATYSVLFMGAFVSC